MYNQSQKEAFIRATHTSSRSIAYTKSIFDMIEPYEVMAGLDVSLMMLEDLQNMINDFDAKETNENKISLFTVSTILRYVIWLKEHHYAVSGVISLVNSVRIEDLKYRMVPSPEKLLEILDDKNYRLYLPTLNSVHLIYRVYLWMAFMGLTDDDALSLKSSDVNLHEMRVELKHKIYDIPRVAFFDFYQVCTLDEFMFGWGYQPSIRPRAEGDEILRASKSNKNVSPFRAEISRRLTVDEEIAKENPDKRWAELSYSRLTMSGLFYRARQKEVKGGEVDFMDYFEHSDEFRTNKDKMKRYNKEYKATYDLWKIAFNNTNL